VVAFELGQRLRVGVEVTEREPAPAFGDRAPLLPACGQGDEISRRRELDIDLQLVLEGGDRTQDRVLFGYELQVHVDRRRPPAGKHGCGAADQVADPVLLGGCVEGREQTLDPLPVG
jgi:hypothetical protein